MDFLDITISKNHDLFQLFIINPFIQIIIYLP